MEKTIFQMGRDFGKSSEPNESRLNNRQKAKQRRRELEDETYGNLKGDKTPLQCYNWWRRKHLCILRGIKDKKTILVLLTTSKKMRC